MSGLMRPTGEPMGWDRGRAHGRGPAAGASAEGGGQCYEKVLTEADILYINRNTHPPPIEITTSGSDHESHAEGITLLG
jgi:hypothetical protein